MVNRPVTFTAQQFFAPDGSVTDWQISDALVSYPIAMEAMEARVGQIAAGEKPECVWLLEHPPLYTAGTSAAPSDLKDPDRFDVYEAGRGGQYTYHGPGQRIAYVMLDLKRRSPDVRQFVAAVEQWTIGTLKRFNIEGERRDDRVGVWVARPGTAHATEDKIAAIGIRIRKWVTFHGMAINVEPDLEHYQGIVPCGVSEHGITSFHQLGHLASMAEVDQVLREEFETIFGPTRLSKVPPTI
jgi:lipoyl(octanoyl) transferase